MTESLSTKLRKQRARKLALYCARPRTGLSKAALRESLAEAVRNTAGMGPPLTRAKPKEPK